MAKILQIQQIKSGIGYKSKAKATLAALGLKRLNQVVEHKDCREIQGMIKSIPYLLKVKEL
jgi:large subunit ribosomal protein L30|tara:strand:- start:802 stop:984 length:183 start_codon:yes stop_codon:yes gene_type:complete